MLEVHDTPIKLSLMDVKFILSMKAKGLRVNLNKETSNMNYLYNKYYDKKGRLSIVMLENQIKKDINYGNDFKVHFVPFVLDAF